MEYFEDAKELLTHAQESFAKIEKVYKDSLSEKKIKVHLLIEIKNLMENLRSSLDYSAHGLFEKYGDKTKKVNIYFPYAWLGLSREDFRQKKIIEKKIPGLSKTHSDIVDKIESYQVFASKKNEWLPKFMDLNNENKHQALVAQQRKETKQLNISSGGVSISMSEGCSIQMGSGCSIQMGGATIQGGQNISVNNPAIISGPAKQEIITWVSFHFKTNNEAVLPFLKTALSVEEC